MHKRFHTEITFSWALKLNSLQSPIWFQILRASRIGSSSRPDPCNLTDTTKGLNNSRKLPRADRKAEEQENKKIEHESFLEKCIPYATIASCPQFSYSLKRMKGLTWLQLSKSNNASLDINFIHDLTGKTIF